jgi:hypothetical protein
LTLARDLITNGADRTIPVEVRRRIKLSGQELEQYREKEKSSSSKHNSSLVEEALDDESNSDTEMEVVTKAGDAKVKVKHDIIMKAVRLRYSLFSTINTSTKAKTDIWPGWMVSSR